MKTTYSQKVLSKGQMTIPSEIRYQLNISPGDKIKFFVNMTNAIITKYTELDKDDDKHYPNVYFATLTEKGQITIPKAIRKKFSLKKDDIINFVIENRLVKMENSTKECPICKGTGKINYESEKNVRNMLPCFVCQEKGEIEKTKPIEEVYNGIKNAAKYKISYCIISQEFEEDINNSKRKVLIYKTIPKVIINNTPGSAYTKEILEKAQDYYQLLLIKDNVKHLKDIEQYVLHVPENPYDNNDNKGERYTHKTKLEDFIQVVKELVTTKESKEEIEQFLKKNIEDQGSIGK